MRNESFATLNAGKSFTLFDQPERALLSTAKKAYPGQDFRDIAGMIPSMTHSPELQVKVSTLEDAYLLIEPGNDGVIFSSGGDVIRETAHFSDGSYRRYDLDDLKKLAKRLECSGFVGFDGSWTNYYHWIVIFLAKAGMYNRYAPSPFPALIPNYRSRRRDGKPLGFSEDVWTQTLAHSKMTGSCHVLEDGIYRVPMLASAWISIDQPAFIGYLSLFYDIFNETKSNMNISKDKSRNIIISRAENPRLTSHASKALAHLVRSEGFEFVELGGLTFREQVQIMSNAGVIVAPHGAGLANMVFSGHDTKVIELNKTVGEETALRPWFYILAAASGRDYTYLNLDLPEVTEPRIVETILQSAAE